MTTQCTAKDIKDQQRFFSRVRQIDGINSCHEWQGCVLKPSSRLSGGGYGLVSYQGKNQSTHRVAYQIHYGAIPAGLYVLHTCDNRKCCNWRHLKLGTHQSNMDDMKAKGRQAAGDRNGKRLYPETILRGEASPTSRLDDREVLSIRELYATGRCTQKRLEEAFGIDQTVISDIVRGATWVHVGGPITLNGPKLTAARGEDKPAAKLTSDKVREIRLLHKDGVGNRAIARTMGVHHKQIGDILSGKAWAHVV